MRVSEITASYIKRPKNEFYISSFFLWKTVMSSLLWGFIMWGSSGHNLEKNWFKIAWHVVRVWMCFYFAPAMQSYLNMTRSDHTGSSVSPCLLILLDLCVHACTFYCIGQCANVPRLLQHCLMVIKVDCVLRPVCNALHVHLRVVHTLACWHAATPCAIVGAGPCDSVVPTDHHVPWLAHERHILAHCDVISNSKSICWNTRISTGDHCQRGGKNKNIKCIRHYLKWCLWILSKAKWTAG